MTQEKYSTEQSRDAQDNRSLGLKYFFGDTISKTSLTHVESRQYGDTANKLAIEGTDLNSLFRDSLW